METKQLKIRVTWNEPNTFLEEDTGEMSVVSDYYYPQDLLFSEKFTSFLTNLEKEMSFKSFARMADGFYQIDLESCVQDYDLVAYQIIPKMEKYLRM